MERYANLIARARAGELVLIDGATGSECHRRGVEKHELGWSGGAALSHPEVVRSIHDDYVAVGADLIVANTFATGANILRDVGTEADFELLNRTAVRLAVEARDAAGDAAASVVVGAGISNWSFSGNRPTLSRLEADTLRQAEIMRDAGAELLSLEMMVDLPQLEATLNAATVVGLPVWVGFSVGGEVGHSVDQLADPIELRDGGALYAGVQLAASHEAVDAMCIMHTDVRLVSECLRSAREHWQGPLGAYAHAGAIIDGEYTHDGVITPEEYAAYLPAWTAAGATMLGGCCGIGPDHLREVADFIRSSANVDKRIQ